MCYAFPGPRCSNRAQKIYDDAKTNYEKAINSGDPKSEQLYNELLDAEKNLHMTPAGQAALSEEIAKTGDPDGSLAFKLEHGIASRKVAIQQAKENDRGDVDEDKSTTPESRTPDMTLSAEYKALEEQVSVRTNDPAFDQMIADRDSTRAIRLALKEKKVAQQELIENLQYIATDPEEKDENGFKSRPYTKEQILDAQDRIDSEYENLRNIVDERLLATYEYHKANNVLENYKNETAQLVAQMNDIAGDPGIPFEGETLGNCVRVAQYDSGTREWLEERQKGIGGSDVGMILRADPEFAQSNFNDFVKSKTEEYSAEEVAEQAAANSGFSGPTGRGNAWEPAIVREYQKQNPDAAVMFSKASWANKDDGRDKANVDGLLSSDGGKTPDGILEIKTASDMSHWEHVDEHGNIEEVVPVGYRAQVLWYLRQTGFKYADIAVMVDDKHYRQRRIYADEAIDPTMVENKDGDKNERIPSMEHSYAKIKETWNTQVEPRLDGTYTKPNPKTPMEKVQLKDNIDMATRQLSAWNDKPHAECVSIIKGYTGYKKAAVTAGRAYLTRDAYMVEEFKKSGPKTWTRDRVFVDIETSGMSPDQGEIIEIGMTRVNPKGEVVFNYTERYGLKDEKALDIMGTGMQEVHKIGIEDIRGKRNFRDPEVQKIMQSHLNDPNAVMVAHNEAFEKRWFNQTVDGFWKKHALNTTLRYQAARAGKPKEVYTTHDTMWSSRYLAHHTTNNKLATFTTGHGVEYLNAHSADADTYMTKDAVYAFDEHLSKAPYGHRWNPEGEYRDEEIYAA